MSTTDNKDMLVYTVKDRCRVCYTCVRECPVKAIKIINGQAEVMQERCIACGNCVNVCSQGAKTFNKQISQVESLLKSNEKSIAAIAPAFPAEFTELESPKLFPGMLKKLGFDKAVEVSFGADLVAKEYNQLQTEAKDKTYISSDCPAVVACVEKHHPDLVENLAPIVSPMVAMARVIREKYGEEIKIVFVGPCIAKKGESQESDFAITFTELRELFERKGIESSDVEEMDFDPPYSGKGAVFPVSHGLLNTMGRSPEVTECQVIVADGKRDFRDAITEFEKGNLNDKHLEILCCDGCIMGPGMSKNGSRLARRSKISSYAKDKLEKLDGGEWKRNIEKYQSIDLKRNFKANDNRIIKPTEEKINETLEKIGKFKPQDHLDCRACGYETCRDHAIAIIHGFAESEMCLPYSIEKMHKTIHNLNVSNENLAKTQQALQQSEKLASMGQLSAGIAHELNNPLGVISMYSNILKDESKEDDPIREDLDLIVEQADRCKNIVGGLLNFARKNQVKLEEVDLIEFCKRSLQSVIIPNQIKTTIHTELKELMVNIDRGQMMQLMTNLEKNAVDAMAEGGELTITVMDNNDEFIIKVSDTGTGIAKENLEKVFTPFFTTKEMGKGTGMGLPLVYGIVKMHKGQINVESNDDIAKGPTGTHFTLRLPKNPII